MTILMPVSTCVDIKRLADSAVFSKHKPKTKERDVHLSMVVQTFIKSE